MGFGLFFPVWPPQGVQEGLKKNQEPWLFNLFLQSEFLSIYRLQHPVQQKLTAQDHFLPGPLAGKEVRGHAHNI
jgi:hypothetical protein